MIFGTQIFQIQVREITYHIQRRNIKLTLSENIKYIFFKSIFIHPKSLQSLSMKSFSRQLTDIFSFAAYKTNGKRVFSSVSYDPFKTHQKLTYRCDAALQLYEYYKKYDFKYSEKGVTPRVLAQEMEIFLKESQDYELVIDSFGYFHVTPSEQYLQNLQGQIEKQNIIQHKGIVIQGMGQQKWHSNNKKIIYLPLETLNLTNLRIAFYLSLLKKKYQSFKQHRPENLVMFMKQRKFAEKDYRFLAQNRIIDPERKTCTFLTGQKLIIEAQGQRSELFINPEDDLLTGTVRHNYIPFKSQLLQSGLANGHEQVQTFGDIIPNSIISEMLYQNKEIIHKILNYSLKFGINIPINLNQQPQQAYHPSELLLQLKNRRDVQKLLIMLDYLQEDKLIDVLALRDLLIGKNNYLPFKVLFNQLNSLII